MQILFIILIVLAFTLPFLSGFSKAICDLSALSLLKFKSVFWDKNLAWKNKWKCDKDGEPILFDGKYKEKFWGSSRWFVALTDGWHLFGVIERWSIRIENASIGLLTGLFDHKYLIALGANYIYSMTIFHIFYTYKILKK